MQLAIKLGTVHGSEALHVKVTDMVLHVHSTLCKIQLVFHSRVSVSTFFFVFFYLFGGTRECLYVKRAIGDRSTSFKVRQRIDFIGSEKNSGSAASIRSK